MEEDSFKISGHSKFKIKILEEDNKKYIKKYVDDGNGDVIDLNHRLYNQCVKQQQYYLYSKMYNNIIVPKVLSSGYDNNKMYFIMEYYNSHNYVEFSEINKFEKIVYHLNTLLEFIEKNIKYSELTTNLNKVFLEKYEKVKSNILHEFNFDKIDDIFYNIKEIFLVRGLNHGDLTFSNMLFSKNGKDIILLDFLDSFIETPLNDIVKLRQDTKHKWIYNVYNDQFDNIRMDILLEKLDNMIDVFFSKYDFYVKYEKIFSIMNLLRILQYAKDEKIIEYIKKELKDKYNV